MVNFLAGAFLGTLAGLGVGGGSLLVLWLTLVLGMAPQEARLLNLLFFLPPAAISTLQRRKSLPFSKLLPAMAAACGAALLGGHFAGQLPTGLLKKLFGLLLLATGLREVFYRERKPR